MLPGRPAINSLVNDISDMLGGSLLLFLPLFYFFPSPPIRSGEAFSSVIFPLFLFSYLFFGCSDGIEREACVCDHGLERSDLCAEIIRILHISDRSDHKILI